MNGRPRYRAYFILLAALWTHSKTVFRRTRHRYKRRSKRINSQPRWAHQLTQSAVVLSRYWLISCRTHPPTSAGVPFSLELQYQNKGTAPTQSSGQTTHRCLQPRRPRVSRVKAGDTGMCCFRPRGPFTHHVLLRVNSPGATHASWWSFRVHCCSH